MIEILALTTKSYQEKNWVKFQLIENYNDNCSIYNDLPEEYIILEKVHVYNNDVIDKLSYHLRVYKIRNTNWFQLPDLQNFIHVLFNCFDISRNIIKPYIDLPDTLDEDIDDLPDTLDFINLSDDETISDSE